MNIMNTLKCKTLGEIMRMHMTPLSVYNESIREIAANILAREAHCTTLARIAGSV